ncbi:hypothetical protein, partial [Halorientalis pallida]|uniref:hypothetical protein n=1 Tax=Halorientalis pallida TaxID=2479928 RepID=UPI00187D67B9
MMIPPADDGLDECANRDGSTTSDRSTRCYQGGVLVLLILLGVAVFVASPVVSASATNEMLDGAGAGPTMMFATNAALATGCTVSETSVQVGESVTIDAPQSDNIDEYQYDKYGTGTFGEYTTQST